MSLPPDQDFTEPVDAPIVAVTVYPHRARVTRRGSVRLPAGRHRVFVEPLPPNLISDSIRVGGQGNAAVLGVDVVRRTRPVSPDPGVAQMRERRRVLDAEQAELADLDAVHLRHTEFLTSLGQRASASYARALAIGSAHPDAVAAFADSLTSQLTEAHARRRDLVQRREEVGREIAALERRLTAAGNRREPDRTAAAVDVEVGEGGTDLLLDLSYMVDGAGWTSSYDVRVDGEKLSLTWYGQVSQRSGEDWPECELALSTARPAETATVPELDPWYLNRYTPPPPPRPMTYPGAAYGQPAMAAPGGPPPMPSAAPMASAVEAAPPPPVVQATATVSQGVTAATYRTARPVAVPSDGQEHRATVAALDLAVVLDHVTAPAVSTDAHLRATVTNTSEHTLLPGKASVFTAGEFVGTTGLQTWAPGEEIELALGVDDRVRVERELVNRKASKATLGATRRQEVEYRIRVTNHTPRPSRLTILDQLPVSRDENIVVRELKVVPPPAERTELGVLTWRFTLPPGQPVEIFLGFRVDVSKGVELVGWRE
ncbi:hypothetical protein Val02_33540 [Virgisporangium aliadipatigenens]|uniref:Mucoidy inhibitor MuiA family protein n=1 Tax=Virgisporangium aliadipatigenens TaxID=741659 RepID=A0A8J4DR69_9ACTN|nr:mucoidy inhibitor MuiA family protein [Virgisporangium aliadipatigenens]GIJ46468.1 hypothetical protein Val02_33540 [Virgisporangium aliadipatigenens]